MVTRSSVVFFVLCFYQLSECIAYTAPQYEYKIDFYHDMPVDHFSFAHDDDRFSLKYLINDTFWDKNGGPIFFYCGNEGDIEIFPKNTGFMWDIAPQFGAMIIFAEHRYYGQSMPYGNQSYQMPYLGKLSSEQAMADYAVLITWLKSNISGADSSPVIAFGGSYGGMLAAWMRIKYPHIIAGAIASAAPILQVSGLSPCWSFIEVVRKVYQDAVPGCDRLIKKSWAILADTEKTEEGQSWLEKNFHLCNDSLFHGANHSSRLKTWLITGWVMLAVINYPYETDFVESVPAWPEACHRIMETIGDHDSVDNATLLNAIYKGISVFRNYTGQRDCYSLGQYYGRAYDARGWGFQVCTEMTSDFCYNESSMFYERYPNVAEHRKSCYHRYGVRKRIDWLKTNYGGKNLHYASNIVFSNGLLDPWHPGSILESISDSVVSILIEDAAHHYDLRGEHPRDTQAIREARKLEASHIEKWIAQWNALMNNGEMVQANNVATSNAVSILNAVVVIMSVTVMK